MSPEENVKKLLANHSRRLQKLRELRALQGMSTDPAIIIEIENIETEIENLQIQLSKHKPQTSSRILFRQVIPNQLSPIESHERLISIGRSPKNLIQIPDQQVSWEHGQIIFMQGSYFYRHLSKSNPSILRRKGEEYLLEAKGTEEIELRSQDRLTIGDRTFIIEFDLMNEDRGYITTAKGSGGVG